MARRARGLLSLLAGLALLSAAFIGSTAPASAESVLVSYGWWYLPNQVPNNVVGPPQPPWVPSDGMYVAGEPEGPFAIAGVRYAAEGPARLTLDLTENGQAGIPSVGACVALTSWDGQSGGRWEGRPAYDCANEVVGEVSEDGATMTFDLPPTIQRVPGVYDLALVPTGLVSFSTTFDRPTTASLVAGPAAAPPTKPSTEATEPEVQDSSTFAGSSFSGSAPDFSSPAASPPAAPATPAQTVRGRLALPAGVIEDLVIPDDRNQRIAAVAGLGLMVLGAWWLAGRTVRPPRLLGSLAARTDGSVVVVPTDTPARGVGRFARPRS